MMSITLLLSLLLLAPLSSSSSLLEAATRRFLKADQVLPANYKNDLYHCLAFNDKKARNNDDSIDCDLFTYTWNTASLDPAVMPARCVGVVVTEADVQDGNDDDYLEPCVWWHVFYGDLKWSELPSASPSEQPTGTPSTSFPSVAPSTPTTFPSTTPSTTFPSTTPSTAHPSVAPSLSFNPSAPTPPTAKPSTATPTAKPSTATPSASPSSSSQKPSAQPSAAPSIDLLNKPRRELTNFILTLTLPPSRNLRPVVDRGLLTSSDELMLLTEMHLQTYLEDSLGLAISTVTLDSVASEYATTHLLEVLEGRVYFTENTVMPTQGTLDFLVRQAFVGLALDDYLRLLQDEAESPLLKSTIYAEVVVEVEEPEEDSSDGFEWTLPLIVIVAGGGAAMLSVCILAYLLCTAKSRRQFAGLTKQGSSDTPATHSGPPEVFEDDSQSDVESDATSVYSYKQHDDSSVSLAPSFMHAITERSALGGFYAESDDDSLKTPSLLWNQEGQATNPTKHQPRPKSVVVGPTRGDEIHSYNDAIRRQQRQYGQEEYGQEDYADQSWADGGGASMGGEESLGGGANSVLYLTDDEEPIKRKDFSHLWDEEEKKEDMNSYPAGELSFEDDIYSTSS